MVSNTYCRCVLTCSDDPDACDRSGEWHTHEAQEPGPIDYSGCGPCPLHPDVPMGKR
jgi:hypothetical protein